MSRKNFINAHAAIVTWVITMIQEVRPHSDVQRLGDEYRARLLKLDDDLAALMAAGNVDDLATLRSDLVDVDTFHVQLASAQFAVWNPLIKCAKELSAQDESVVGSLLTEGRGERHFKSHVDSYCRQREATLSSLFDIFKKIDSSKAPTLVLINEILVATGCNPLADKAQFLKCVFQDSYKVIKEKMDEIDTAITPIMQGKFLSRNIDQWRWVYDSRMRDLDVLVGQLVSTSELNVEQVKAWFISWPESQDYFYKRLLSLAKEKSVECLSQALVGVHCWVEKNIQDVRSDLTEEKLSEFLDAYSDELDRLNRAIDRWTEEARITVKDLKAATNQPWLPSVDDLKVAVRNRSPKQFQR